MNLIAWVCGAFILAVLVIAAVTAFTVNRSADEIYDASSDAIFHTASNAAALRASIMPAN